MTEALRLFLVVQAFGFADVSLGLSGAVFVALIGSLLTAVPLSPAGLGIVEAGIVGVLTVAYGVPLPEATAIALLDRVISVFSIIVFGSIAYAISPKPRGLGRIAGSGGRPDELDTGLIPAVSAACAVAAPNVRGRCARVSARFVRHAPATPVPMSVLHPARHGGRTLVMVAPASGTATECRKPHPNRPLHSRARHEPPVRTGDTGPYRATASSWYRLTHRMGPAARGQALGAPRQHDHPERPSVQRMASSSAQGQEDVAAPARPAVRRGSLDHLPADPRRPHALPGDRHQARPRAP